MRKLLTMASLLGLALPSPVPAAPYVYPPPPPLSVLAEVQREVNTRVKYVAEKPGHDVWIPAYLTGDCEDYALAKREELIHRGVPVDSLGVLFLLVQPGGKGPKFGHAILLARGGGTTWALDMSGPVMPVEEYLLLVHGEPVCIAKDLRPIDKPAGERC